MGSTTDRLTPDSDEWWVTYLTGRLMDDQQRIADLKERYDNGFLEKDFGTLIEKDHFKRFLSISRMNLTALVVNTMMNRLRPMAFKTAADNDEDGDREADKIMKRCDLTLTFKEIIRWASIFGRAYGMATKVDGKSWITSEHPSQMFAEVDPVTRRVVAAVKVYHDRIRQMDYVVLYRKNYLVEYSTPAPTTTITQKPGWGVDFDTWSSIRRLTGTDRPPIAPFGDGVGDIQPHIGSLDRVNHTLMQRLVIISYQAFRQRGIKGVPNTDAKGVEIDYSDIFVSDPGSLWLLPPNAEMWESAQGDLSPILNAVKDDIRHLAVESSTPLYAITPDAANGSAEGASLQRETHLAKVRDRIDAYTGPLRTLMALAFQLQGDKERSSEEELDPIWEDPTKSSLTEMASSAAQASQAGVPWRFIMTHFIKMTPQELADAERDRQKEQMMGALNGQQSAASTAGRAEQGNQQPNSGTGQAAAKPLEEPESAN